MQRGQLYLRVKCDLLLQRCVPPPGYMPCPALGRAGAVLVLCFGCQGSLARWANAKPA